VTIVTASKADEITAALDEWIDFRWSRRRGEVSNCKQTGRRERNNPNEMTKCDPPYFPHNSPYSPDSKNLKSFLGEEAEAMRSRWRSRLVPGHLLRFRWDAAANHEHGNRRLAQDDFGHASHKKVLKPTASVCAHHDEIGFEASGVLEQLECRYAAAGLSACRQACSMRFFDGIGHEPSSRAFHILENEIHCRARWGGARNHDWIYDRTDSQRGVLSLRELDRNAKGLIGAGGPVECHSNSLKHDLRLASTVEVLVKVGKDLLHNRFTRP
jgi:hypothetical protein